jgi:integrase
VFKKTVTKPLPAGAETFTRKGERFARWKDRKGKTRTAPLTEGNDGSDCIVIESSRYVAKFRDGAGVVQVVPTGCRDEGAARRVLADLERRAELVRAGVLTPGENAVADHQAIPLDKHFDAFEQHLQAKGVTRVHKENTRRWLDRVASECRFLRLADLDLGAFERWLTERTAEGMSARNRNAHREALVGFGNWCVRAKRLTANPFRGVPKANQKADPRRQRRAMAEDELVKLLAVARERPLLDALTVRRGPRKGERYANVSPEVRDRLALLGRERALTYKTLVLTGLRKGELASLTAAHLHLDDDLPHLTLDAADEKNREGSAIPLRDDLAADLRAWLADKLRRLQEEARQAGAPIPARLPPDTPVFNVPAALVKILDRDLRLAGIPKRDDRGRTLDVHALRTTFGTLLSKGGVAPRTAQAAMRHSDIDLTMNVYTDPRLLDVGGALDVLPSLPLGGDRAAEPEAVRATGTDGERTRKFAPGFAPTQGKRGQTGSTAGKAERGSDSVGQAGTPATNASPVKGKGPLTAPVNGPHGVGVTGLEPATSWSRSKSRRGCIRSETSEPLTVYTNRDPFASMCGRLRTGAKNSGISAVGRRSAEEARKSCGSGTDSPARRRALVPKHKQAWMHSIRNLRPGLIHGPVDGVRAVAVLCCGTRAKPDSLSRIVNQILASAPAWA